MTDIAALSVLSSSALSKPEVVTPVAPPRVAPVVAPTEFYVSPYTLIDSTTSKAILVLRDTSTGDIQVQVPAQVNIDSSIAAESSQSARHRSEAAATQSSASVPEALQPQVIEPSAVVVTQQFEQQSSTAKQQVAPVPEAVNAALSQSVQLSQQPIYPQVSLNA